MRRGFFVITSLSITYEPALCVPLDSYSSLQKAQNKDEGAPTGVSSLKLLQNKDEGLGKRGKMVSFAGNRMFGNMKKVLITVALLLMGLVAWAQNITIGENVPQVAVEVLQPRLMQMLQAGSVADAPLQVEARVVKQLETPGSSGDAAETFLLKGVGENEADAWVRAMKQFLPRSKSAQGFVAQLKP